MVESSRLVVILAEDDPATSILARINLEKLGLKVDLAHDGAEAFQKWRAGGHKAVLLDFNMPRMSGLDVARSIRQEEKEKGQGHTRIILLTAKPLDHLESLQTMGVVDFMIPKPVNYADVLSKLEDLLPGKAGAAAIPASSAGAPLDLDELAHSVGMDGLADILRIFFTQAHKYIEQMEQALGLEDAEQISQIAHKLKGSSAQFTAHGLVAPSEFLQRNCATGDLTGAGQKLEILKKELEKVQSFAALKISGL